MQNTTITTLEIKKNTFTVRATMATENSTKLFRADLDHQQQVSMTVDHKYDTLDKWVLAQENSTYLKAADAAWCGKALLAEAMRYQFANKSKRLTKTLLERCPLMEYNQSRYEEDIAFQVEEQYRAKLVTEALHQKFSEGELEQMDEDEIEDERELLDRTVRVPELEAKDIVAPVAPELAQAMWQDFDVVLGVAHPRDISKPASVKKNALQSSAKSLVGSGMQFHQQQPAGFSASVMPMTPEETKNKYCQTINTFTQLQLWRVKRSKCKYQ